MPVTRDRRILGPSILNFDVRGARYLPALAAALPDARALPDQRQHAGQPLLAAQAEVDQGEPAGALPRGGFPASLGGLRLLHARRGTRCSTTRWRTARSCSTWTARTGRTSCSPGPGSIGRSCRRCARPARWSAQVLPSVAEELGLPPGVLIAMGTHDQCVQRGRLRRDQDGPGDVRHGHLRLPDPGVRAAPRPGTMIA